MKRWFGLVVWLFSFTAALATTHEESERDCFIGNDYGTPDPNNAPYRLVDDFRYQPPTDPPTNHRWKILNPGTGTVSTVFDNACQSYVMQVVPNPGQTILVQYPDTGSLASKKEYLAFMMKGNSFTIKVELTGDSSGVQKAFHLLFMPIAGADSLVGDTLRLHLGNGLSSGNWYPLNLALEDKLRSLKPNHKFIQFNRIVLSGNFSADEFFAWEWVADIEGYASKTSVPQGGSIDLKISLIPDSAIDQGLPYRFEVYRAGKTLELKATSPNRVAYYRSTRPDSLWWYGAGWPTDTTLIIPTNWPSGVYLVKLIALFPPLDGLGFFYIPFVVTEDQPGSTSNILFQTAVNTYQAYNVWGGGSFYDALDTVISFDRPYQDKFLERPLSGNPGAEQFFFVEYPMVKWLENRGYTVEYCTDIDLHSIPYSLFLQKYKLFLSGGHAEYWSEQARNKVEIDFRGDTAKLFGAPKRMAFFCANTCFQRVRFDLDPVNFRKMKCVKHTDSSRIDFDFWRKPGLHRPEAEMIGIQSIGTRNVHGNGDTVKNTTHWIIRGTGLLMNEAFGDSIIGHEVDSKETGDIAFPPGVPAESVIVLAAARYQGDSGIINPSQATYYRYPASGAEVFAAGTIRWSWGLNAPNPGSITKTARITKNVIDGFASTFRGHVTQNMTWAGNIYLGGDVTIDAGVTVTINPGTKIYFFPNNDVERTGGDTNKTELVVKGTLACVGTQQYPIIFTSASTSPTRGDWGGVFVEHPGRANIDFTQFSYAGTVLTVRDTCTVRVRNSTFDYFKILSVYTTNNKVNLGVAPNDCGKNNILMPTADPAAKAVRSDAASLMKAEGDWWGSAPPDTGWFIGTGEVDYVPYLFQQATPNSTCPVEGGGGCGNGPGNQPCFKIADVGGARPLKFELAQNYPNPFNAATVIRLPQPSRVELRIYNILGQAVRAFTEEKPAGFYELLWDGRDENGIAVSSGIYLYQIRAASPERSRGRDFVETKKMQLIK